MYPALQGLPYEDLDLHDGIPIIQLLRRAWRLFFADGNIFINYLVFFLLLAGSSAIPFATLIISGPLMVGISYQYLKFVRREKVDLNGLFDGFHLFGQALAVYLLYSVIMFGGVLLCFVGVIVFAIWYFCLWYVIVDGEREVWPAFLKSKELISGFGWQILLFMLVAGLFNFVGVLFCVVGVMVTAPITMLASAMLYDLLCAHKGMGIRDPDYMRRYWQTSQVPEAGPSVAIPEVGPIPEAQPVREEPIDFSDGTTATDKHTPSLRRREDKKDEP